jgi:hypothetical protein
VARVPLTDHVVQAVGVVLYFLASVGVVHCKTSSESLEYYVLIIFNTSF